jgi:hypothetical protein
MLGHAAKSPTGGPSLGPGAHRRPAGPSCCQMDAHRWPSAAPHAAAGKLLMVHTKLGGQFVLRMAIGGTGTQGEHVAAAWKLIGEEADALLSEA